MIAVIIPPGPTPAMHGLDEEQSLALLPLGDRPILQHIIESLVSQGIKTIEVITCHAPEKVEAMLGNGDRWGCRFQYHLAADPERPYRSLKVIAKTRCEPWVLIHVERYPCISFSADAVAMPRLYYAPQRREEELVKWGGTAVFPAGDFGDLLAEKSFEELDSCLSGMMQSGEATAVAAPDWIDASTPAALLQTQARLLRGELDGLMITGIERQPGIWISRNVEIHPSAVLTAPIYIGPNCRINRGAGLGPDVVISAGCLVDCNTSIERSLTLAGSYIGEGLELSEAIVQHDALVNARIGTKVDVAESFLLGSVEQQEHESWMGRGFEVIAAGLLLVLVSPILLLSVLCFGITRRRAYTTVEVAKTPLEPHTCGLRAYRLGCFGADAWKTQRAAGWSAFVTQFVPGLAAVLAGRVRLVGLPPKSAAEIEALPSDWRALYERGRAGLITEAAVAATDAADETQLYLADAYYAAKRSFGHDLQLALKYLLRLMVPVRAANARPIAAETKSVP